jgi:type I restriction enzyme S subunit
MKANRYCLGLCLSADDTDFRRFLVRAITGLFNKVLKTDVYRHIFRVNTSASVDRRGSLRWKEFAKIPVPLPPIEEQKQIALTLNTAHQEIELLKKQLEAFRKQKRGLMQKLLTGRWRVKIKET